MYTPCFLTTTPLRCPLGKRYSEVSSFLYIYTFFLTLSLAQPGDKFTTEQSVDAIVKMDEGRQPAYLSLTGRLDVRA